MVQMRNNMTKYYSDLINQIEVKCEKTIQKNKLKDKIEEINEKRQNIILKIKEIEQTNLSSLNENSNPRRCCYFHTESDYKESNPFVFEKTVGRLIIVISELHAKLIHNFEICYGNFGHVTKPIAKQFRCFEDGALHCVYDQLISRNRSSDYILDFCDPSQNILEKYKASAWGNLIQNSDFDFLPLVLNLNQMKTLKLSPGPVPEISNNIFKNFHNITKLILNYNPKTLVKNTFIGLDNLNTLKLIDNKSLEIENGAFNGLNNLKRLEIDSSHMKRINCETFNGLDNLEIIELVEIEIDILESDFLNNLTKLKSIEISIKKIKSKVDKGMSICFENLKSLQIDGLVDILSLDKFSNLEFLKVTSQNFNASTLSSLTELKLLDCYVQDIEVLSQLKNLEFLNLNLSNDSITKFEMVNLPSVKFLILTCNTVPQFNTSFSNLKGLSLVVSNHFDHDKFVNLSSLDFFHFESGSQSVAKKAINPDYLRGIKKLKYFGINFPFKRNGQIKEQMFQDLSNLFEMPSSVICKYDDYSNYQMTCNMKNGERFVVTQYFKRYLPISDCVKEFILNLKYESSYIEAFNTYFDDENTEDDEDSGEESDD